MLLANMRPYCVPALRAGVAVEWEGHSNKGNI